MPESVNRLLHEISLKEHNGQNARESVREVSVVAILLWLSYLPVGLMKPLQDGIDPVSFQKTMPGRGARLVQRFSSLNVLGDVPNSHSKLLLWILGIGIVNEDDTAWCARTFAKLGRNLSLTSYEDVSALFEGYLWFENFDRLSYNVIANLLNALTEAEASRTVVDYTAATRSGKPEEGEPTRVTNRPSNSYRMGA